jgi:hypothetical protein
MRDDPRFKGYKLVWAFHEPDKFQVEGAEKIKTDGLKYFKTALAARVYLRVAGHLFQQPTYHARKILELTDLYDAKNLDKVLLYAISQSKLDITSFKMLLKEKYFEIIQDTVRDSTSCSTSVDTSLTRSCEYYEQQKEVIQI